jgi:hypothetical protein
MSENQLAVPSLTLAMIQEEFKLRCREGELMRRASPDYKGRHFLWVAEHVPGGTPEKLFLPLEGTRFNCQIFLLADGKRTTFGWVEFKQRTALTNVVKLLDKYDQLAYTYIPITDRFTWLNEPGRCTGFSIREHAAAHPCCLRIIEAVEAPRPPSKKLKPNDVSDVTSEDTCASAVNTFPQCEDSPMPSTPSSRSVCVKETACQTPSSAKNGRVEQLAAEYVAEVQKLRQQERQLERVFIERLRRARNE